MPTLAPAFSLWRDTLVGLAAPRRAVPILLVAAPLVGAQAWYADGDPEQVGAALVAIGTFLLSAPFLWRWLVSRWSQQPAAYARGLLVYALVGGAPAALLFVAAQGWGLRGVSDRPSFLGEAINAMISAGLFWVGGWGLGRDLDQEQALVDAEARADAARDEAERARLLAIQAHLDPHFLFNTLNAIAEWTRQDPEVAERAILRLSGLLREVLGGLRADRWPLDREVQLVADVWALYQVRDPDWFTIRWEVTSLPDATVPPLLLLPLVENAVKHGPAAGHRGELRLAVRREAGQLVVEVDSPGPFGGERPGSTGLPMVQRRLALACGPDATLHVGPHGAGTRARVRWTA